MIVIMGPGRCGTTVVIRLFQAMGFDTGNAHEIFRERSHSELRSSHFKWPRVIKGTGTLCVGLNKWADQGNWNIEVVILCVREYEEHVERMVKWKRGRGGYKGLTPEELEKRIRFELIEGYSEARKQISKEGCKLVEVEFPRLRESKDYCYSVLNGAVPEFTRKQFDVAWDEVIDE